MLLGRASGLGLVLALLVAPAWAGDSGEAELLLEVYEPARPGFVPEAAPLRFGLWDEGHIVVGGTSALMSGRLEKSEFEGLTRRMAVVRKLGLGTQVALGSGPRRFHLRLPRARLEYFITGEPRSAPANLQPLAQLLSDLAVFDHASLRPLRPSGLEARAVEQTQPGGCRPWTLDVPLAELASGSRTLSFEQAADWPHGANVAAVCERGRRFAVTFRPLAPGEPR